MRGSGVFMWVGYSEIFNNRARQPLLLRCKSSSDFWEKLSCPASLNMMARTARLCGRETAAFHISSCLPHSRAVFHTPGREAVSIRNVSQLDKKS